MDDLAAPFLLLFSLIFAIPIGINIYQAWFEPDKTLERSRRKMNNISNWYPFRKWIENGKSWIDYLRLLSALEGIGIILWYVLIIEEWITGKL